MKILAVLSALATIAIAAPALEEYGDNTRLTSNDFTITQQREKKSTLEETLSEKPLEHSEDHLLPKIANKFGPGSTNARTFSGFKKPIIVKKKIGYHVYRDSDEEQAQADSRESCKEPIKVKLCNDKNSVEKMKSASIHHTHEDISENEMKHSINMAKEAVETFQRDLQKIDSDFQNNGKIHTGLGANKELREDIEKARQALEHIQRKFEKIDTDTTDATIPDTHLKMIQEGEERMAKWKEAVGNHKDFEIARNLEDNFKTMGKVATNLQTSNLISNNVKSIEDVNVRSSKPKEDKDEDEMISVVDKTPKMEIHSDSLIKEKSKNKDEHGEDKRLTMSEKNVNEHNDIEKTTDNISTHIQEESKSSAECNDHEHKNHQHASTEVQENKERSNDDETKEKNNSDMKEKHTWDKLENIDMLKSTMDSPMSDMVNHMQLKGESALHSDRLRSKDENDHKMQESKLDASPSTTNPKIVRSGDSDLETEGISTKTNKHNENEKHQENVEQKEQKSTSLRQSAKIPDHSQANMQNTVNTASVLSSVTQSLLDNEDSSQNFLRTDMDPARSSLSTTTTKLDDEKGRLRNHMDERQESHQKVHQMLEHTRASSNFHKNLLNNMDFVEDSHQSSFDKHSPTEISHKLKNEKQELHERVNVPLIQPDADHLKNIIHLSDNSQDHTNQRAQLKMATMFNNEQPNLNVQFNSPQTFEEQTNIQRLMPFKSAEEIHDEHFHKLDFDTLHNKGEIPSDVHDPLHTRWANENHLQKLNTASQFRQDNMEMDGSSPHFSIDRSMPLRSNSVDGHHMGFNEHLNAQQRWMQEKNANSYKTATANTGLTLQNAQRNENSHLISGMRKSGNNFEQLHDHGNLNVMHSKSNMNTAMQLNNLMQMRGAPKMALEYTEPNQWAHNHGSFRSSYGPSSYGPSSYGSGGASASGGPAVGLFPNANVGNCAVPLLLSCSPSVVSGSLAKTSSNTYSAPSYRSEDVNFHKKRDIDITKGTPGIHVHRHIPLGHQSIILEKKL